MPEGRGSGRGRRLLSDGLRESGRGRDHNRGSGEQREGAIHKEAPCFPPPWVPPMGRKVHAPNLGRPWTFLVPPWGIRASACSHGHLRASATQSIFLKSKDTSGGGWR